MLGQLVGDRYQLLERVATTTRASIYRAVDRQTGETLAVKLVDESLAADSRFIAHFHRQAHVAAELAQPNLARLYDYGRFDHTYFLVEEWVEGATLERYLDARGPLPVADALAIAGAVAAALAAGHRAGLVHGGVAPEDIVVRADGVVKLGGFGLAKPGGMPTRPETAEHRAMAYCIAPEQAQGEAAVPASDVYALGAVLYWMLAGRPPFEGATPLAVALKHVNEDPPSLRSLRPDLPAAVAELVMRALAKQPARRYRDGVAMDQAIRALPEYRPDLRPAPLVAAEAPSLLQRLTTPPVSWLAGILLALLILTVGAALLLMAGTAVRQQPRSTPTPPATVVVPVTAPALVGLPLSDAERLAGERQLRLDVSERPDPQIPRGSVLSQSPEPGAQMNPGDTVRVVVSQGPSESEVPNLLGSDLAQAREALDRARLRLGSASQRPSAPGDQGRILGQNPPPSARVPEGSYVDVTVGAGPPAIATPAPPSPTAPAPSPTVPVVVPPSTPTATPSPSPSPSPATPSPSPTVSPLPSPTPSPAPASPTATPTLAPASPTPSPTESPSPSPTSTTPAAIVSPAPGTPTSSAAAWLAPLSEAGGKPRFLVAQAT